jgi:hypothetical protein
VGLIYFFNKYFKFILYDLWVWWGKRDWVSETYTPYRIWKWIGNKHLYGMTLYERFELYEKIKQKLQDEYEQMEKKYGKDFELYGINE